MNSTELIVGCTWDRNQLLEIAELNDRFAPQGIRVAELYGSMRSQYTCVPSARPDFRIPDIGFDEFKVFVSMARSFSIGVNYTCNATLHCSVHELFCQRERLSAFFKRLEDMGVARLTISNPLLIEIACEACDLPMSISTIFHPNVISQIPVYSEWRADRICLDIYRNRDISFLRDFNRAATALGIAPVLIANEFCMYGNTPCHGILRQSCYEHSSLGGNEQQRFSGWPFSRCHAERMKHLHSWLQARFILPQHLDTYTRLTGIRHFKITGRTFSTPHVLKLIMHYLNKTFDEPLPVLWLDPGNPTTDEILSAFDVTSTELEEVGFFRQWFEKDRICDYACGFSCFYCEEKYAEIMNKRKVAI
jgi:collagenase-like PrtC family protease